MARDWKPVKKPGKRRLKDWRNLGQDQPIERLDDGLKRVVSQPSKA